MWQQLFLSCCRFSFAVLVPRCVFYCKLLFSSKTDGCVIFKPNCLTSWLPVLYFFFRSIYHFVYFLFVTNWRFTHRSIKLVFNFIVNIWMLIVLLYLSVVLNAYGTKLLLNLKVSQIFEGCSISIVLKKQRI